MEEKQNHSILDECHSQAESQENTDISITLIVFVLNLQTNVY